MSALMLQDVVIMLWVLLNQRRVVPIPPKNLHDASADERQAAARPKHRHHG